MTEPNEQEGDASPSGRADKPRPISYFALLSFAAAVLGSAAGTFLFVAYELHLSGLSGWGVELVGFFILVWLVAGFFAVPASLVLGTPLLWLGQRPVRAYPLPTAVAFALIGAAAAIGINHVPNRNTIDPDRELGAMMMFGATVAATHVIVLYYRRRRSLWRATLVAAFALVIGSAGCRAMLDWIQNRAGERQYLAECRSDTSVIVMDRSRAEQLAQHLRRGGNLEALQVTRRIEEWHGHSREPLLHAHSVLHVGGTRTLVVNDVAYAPFTLAARLGFARPVRGHCLGELGGPEAELARRAGLVSAPDQPAGRLPLF